MLCSTHVEKITIYCLKYSLCLNIMLELKYTNKESITYQLGCILLPTINGTQHEKQ